MLKVTVVLCKCFTLPGSLKIKYDALRAVAENVGLYVTLTLMSHDTRTRNRHRKPVPENWYHKPARR